MNLTIDQAVILAAIVGSVFGAFMALYYTRELVEKYKATQYRKYADLINMAMSNAYTAGYTDGANAAKPRPSKASK